MIPLFSHQDWQNDDDERAHVDDAGHIFIHGNEAQPIIQPKKEVEAQPVMRTSMWEVTENDEIIRSARKEERKTERTEQVVNVLKSVRGNILTNTGSVLEEGKSQYIHSYHRASFHLSDISKAAGKGSKALWSFLSQPVWVMRKNNSAKQYNRGTLFMLDAVRFGGTFSAIFVALFVSLNYQSFFQIITPYLDPVERISQSGNVSGIDSALKDKLMKSPMLATAGREEGNLLSYLPSIGPPENRIIVPKLGLNVPLVTPSYSSLLKEDWEGVEEDIQDALKHGVVHYPGTARPGQAGNFFVTGHSSYYPWADGKYKTVFARMHEMNVGDEYWVYYGGDKHRYIVQSKREVKPSDVTVLDQPTNKRIATLMTCTPVGTTLRRLIITSQEVDPVTGIAMQVGERETRVVQDVLPTALPI
ncbi:sortase [Candidatus Peregrinibacteria bacterium]|nr:sortase [Candidatus Peregrinibacteria bacterium]MBT5468842.1 sortase [Candidatus Peregrinibacteria bacterium]